MPKKNEPKIYCILSGKGGVGKSAVAAFLALQLKKNLKVLFIDFDICGPSAAIYFNVTGKITKHKNGFKPLTLDSNLDILSFGNILGENDVVIWRGAKKQIFLELMFNTSLFKDEDGNFIYDAILIDTPPGISEEHGFLVGKKNVHSLIVTTGQNLALNCCQSTIEFCLYHNLNIIGVIQNMSYYVCECCHEKIYLYGKNGGKLLAEEYGIEYLGEIPMESQMLNAIEQGQFPSYCEATDIFNDIQRKISHLL